MKSIIAMCLVFFLFGCRPGHNNNQRNSGETTGGVSFSDGNQMALPNILVLSDQTEIMPITSMTFVESDETSIKIEMKTHFQSSTGILPGYLVTRAWGIACSDDDFSSLGVGSRALKLYVGNPANPREFSETLSFYNTSPRILIIQAQFLMREEGASDPRIIASSLFYANITRDANDRWNATISEIAQAKDRVTIEASGK